MKCPKSERIKPQSHWHKMKVGLIGNIVPVQYHKHIVLSTVAAVAQWHLASSAVTHERAGKWSLTTGTRCTSAITSCRPGVVSRRLLPIRPVTWRPIRSCPLTPPLLPAGWLARSLVRSLAECTLSRSVDSDWSLGLVGWSLGLAAAVRPV